VDPGTGGGGLTAPESEGETPQQEQEYRHFQGRRETARCSKQDSFYHSYLYYRDIPNRTLIGKGVQDVQKKGLAKTVPGGELTKISTFRVCHGTLGMDRMNGTGFDSAEKVEMK
jgi:hypothetical protein